MEITQITENWKNYSSFIIDALENDFEFSDEELARVDEAAVPLLEDASFDLVAAKIKKIISLNILDSHFELFDFLPKTWKYLYRNAIKVVASEYGEIPKYSWNS